MSDLPAETPARLDLLLVARYALLVSLTQLIPIPILDWIADDFLRRRLTRLQLHGFEVDATSREVGLLGGGSAGGCLGILWSIVSWPFKRLLRYLLWVLLIKAMIDAFSDVVARAILLHEALTLGLFPGDAVQVRAAMQRALSGVDTRPLERAVGIVFRSTRGELRRLWRGARARMRDEAERERKDVETDVAIDEAPLDDDLERLTEALARAVWVPEVHEQLRDRFRKEARTIPSPPTGEAT